MVDTLDLISLDGLATLHLLNQQGVFHTGLTQPSRPYHLSELAAIQTLNDKLNNPATSPPGPPRSP